MDVVADLLEYMEMVMFNLFNRVTVFNMLHSVKATEGLITANLSVTPARVRKWPTLFMRMTVKRLSLNPAIPIGAVSNVLLELYIYWHKGIQLMEFGPRNS